MLHSRGLKTGGIVLAAQGPLRLNDREKPKSLLRYGGKSLLRHAAETMIASQCKTVAAVLGAATPELHGELLGLSIVSAIDPDGATGGGSSVRIGFETLLEHAGRTGGLDAILLLPCDQPLITADRLDEFIYDHIITGQPIVAARYGPSFGLPALFGKTYFPDLLSLHSNSDITGIIHRHPEDVQAISLPEHFTGIDTPEDYERLRQPGNRNLLLRTQK